MLRVIATTWPLLLGVMLLMVGNGIQGTLLGIRGTLQGFDTFELSIVTSAYFLGFLIGSRLAPVLIQKVGHVRVFAALASIISAVLVLYPVLLEWQIWAGMRVLIGLAFAGVYITSESWLNNAADNETRGQALSAYMIVQMLGIVAAQGLIAWGNPLDFVMFVIPSVLISFSFIPLLLAATQTPTFETQKSLGFRELFRISPLGCVGMLISGGVFSAMFGMASVWGTVALLSVKQIAMFTTALYVGGLLMQYPMGWLSDRMDRRKIMLTMAVIAALVMGLAAAVPLPFWALLPVAVVLGGVTYPMYSLLIAYTNDFLSREQMAAASAGMVFLNGFGAIFGPIVTGWLMGQVGARGFFLFIGILYTIQAIYAGWRMTRRATPDVTGRVAPLAPTASSLAVGAVIDNELPPAPRSAGEAEGDAADPLAGGGDAAGADPATTDPADTAPVQSQPG